MTSIEKQARHARRVLIANGASTQGLDDHMLIAKAATFAAAPAAPAAPQEAPAPAPTPAAPQEAPAPAPTPAAATDAQQAALAALMATLTPAAPAIDESRIKALIKEHATTPRPITVKASPERPPVVISTPHKQFEDVLMLIECDLYPYLYGPAGTGKSTLARQLAKATGRDFYSSAKLATEFQLTGFNTADGSYSPTAFYNAFTKGGLFLFDELDASAPAAVTAFNDALASREFTFPNSVTPVKAHATFTAIGAGNTPMNGASRVYTSRQPQDGAAIDRFDFIEITYDTALEHTIALTEFLTYGGKESAAHKLTTTINQIQSARTAALAASIPTPITPRASIGVARKMGRGMTPKKAFEGSVYKGMTADQRKIIKAAI